MEEIKKLYAMRWGIETSFRELKYAIGLACFHTFRPSQSQTQVSGEFSVSSSLTSIKEYRFLRQIAIRLFVMSESREIISKTKKVGRDRNSNISA